MLAAAKCGDLQLTEELVFSQRAHVDVCDDTGMTALILASCHGHFDLVTFLLNRGATINHLTDAGITALLGAYRTAHNLPLPQAVREEDKANPDPSALIAVCELLLQRGGDPDGNHVVDGLLQTAVAIEDDRMVRMLLKYSANPNVLAQQDPLQRTPLVHAAMRIASINTPTVRTRLEAIVTHLTESGAALNTADALQRTALHHCALAGQPQHVLTILLKAGADPDLTSADDMTPLGLAVSAGALEAVLTLLKHNASPNVPQGPNKDQVLHLAAMGAKGYDVDLNVRLTMVQRLLEAEADPTLPVPVMGVRDPAARGTGMDSIHHCFFKAQHVIGRLSRAAQNKETVGGVLDAREKIAIEQSIANAIMTRMRDLALTLPTLKQAFCIECGRAYRQHLQPFSGSAVGCVSRVGESARCGKRGGQRLSEKRRIDTCGNHGCPRSPLVFKADLPC
jgi:ankyrin repeat protein